MSHFSDYMDDVTVKISEKFKRPMRIDLPTNVVESPLRAQNVIESIKYCSTYEKNVLAKIKELRSAKEKKKNERRHRLQLLEEAKQKKLDVIAAAEAQEKLKQLSVSEVSYPSTEEISTMSPDEIKLEQNCDTETSQRETPEVIENNNDIYPTCSTADNVSQHILQPIPVQAYPQNSLLDDPDPLQELKMNTKITRIPQYHNVEKLTYKDFENDTSSPFDNVELKTINDMELLAQVLQNQKDVNCVEHAYDAHPSYVQNCGSLHDGIAYVPNSYIDQHVQDPTMYSSPQHYPITNGYYVPENVCENTIPGENMYVPNYQYYVPAQYQVVDPNYYPPQMGNPEMSTMANELYIPQPYYFQYPQAPANYPTYDLEPSSSTAPDPIKPSSTNLSKSKSRSVPDIFKELDEELALAKLREKERSFNPSPVPKEVPKATTNDKKEERRKKKSEQLPNPFEKLNPKQQEMCKRINGMGFPLDRVARVCKLLGDSDKTVIEGLLMVGELMDLGFSEGKVSAALAKHQFNKDKALDELVT